MLLPQRVGTCFNDAQSSTGPLLVHGKFNVADPPDIVILCDMADTGYPGFIRQ